MPEIFAYAEELTTLVPPEPDDVELPVYLNALCPKNSFTSSKMRKPRVGVVRGRNAKVPLEKAREDKRAAAWLKANILLHAYLNNLPVTPAHQQALHRMLSKAPELLRVLFDLSMYPRMKGKPGSLALARTVVRFIQFVYQGLWVEDSQLKQLPHMTDRVGVGRWGEA